MRSLHKQLAASRAFDALADKDKDAVASLSQADKNDAYDAWTPDDEQLRAAKTSALGRFYDELCLLRPDLAWRFHFGDNRARVIVSRSADHKVQFDGFDRDGNKDGFDPYSAALEIAESLPKPGEL